MTPANAPSEATALLAAARIAGVLLAAPFFGSRLLPLRLRIGWALALGVSLMGAGGLVLPAAGLSSLLSLAPHFAGELCLGALMGAASLFVLAALRGAAVLVSQQSGLSFAAVLQTDAGDSGDALRSLYAGVGLLTFLGLGLDRSTLRMVADSFQAVPAGATLGGDAVWWAAAGVARSAGHYLFEAAALLVLPLLALFLGLSLLQGLLSRAAPELDAFALGLPLRVVAGLGAMVLVLPATSRVLGRLLEASIGEGMQVVERLTG